MLYLQYGAAGGGGQQYPYATTAFDTNALISGQAYDVVVSLDMPRCKSNLEAGNFMLDLSLLGPNTASDGKSNWLSNVTAVVTQSEDVLYHARRPAILPYTRPILDLAHMVLHLPWHLFGMRDLDRSVLNIPMFELLSFPRGGRNIPSHARLEVQSSSVLQIYDAELSMRARFQGLRYVVYNYRVVSFVVFTTLFYCVSIASLGLSSALISRLWASRSEGGERMRIKQEGQDTKAIKAEGESSTATAKIKSEEEDESSAHGGLSLANISDTPAQYPTGRGRQPLNYPGRSPSEASRPAENEEHPGQQTGAGEAADDEDEGDVVKEEEEDDRARAFDSGIGTSMESEQPASSVRRRSSKGTGGRKM